MNRIYSKINITTIFFIATTLVLAAILLISKTRGSEENEYDSTTILNKIVHIQELALVKYNYSGVIAFKDFKKILNINVPLTEKYFLLKYNGNINAGVDFSKIKVDVKGESVRVSIPKAKILNTTIDENSVKIYDESENAFNPIKISDYNSSLVEEKNKMTQDAVSQGILKEANEQAKLAITSLLNGMGFNDIEVMEEIAIPQLH